MTHTPFDPAAMLRGLAEPNSVLSGLVLLLEDEWARFHARPDEEALARVNDLARAVRAQLRAVDTVLDATTAAGFDRARVSASRAPADPITPDETGGPSADALPVPEAEPLVSTAPSPSVAPTVEPVYPPFRDQATGLFTREGFDAAASGELKKCRRHERPFAILLLQLGVREDEALRKAATTIRRVVRESDLAGRHVDRTFAIGLSEAAISDARLVAGRIIETLEGGGAWGSAGRIGLAGYPVDGETLPGLLEVARGQLSLLVTEVLEPSHRSS
jgi:hypothetical protein